MTGRIRVQAVVTREEIVSHLGGVWRRLLPRFKPLILTVIAFDGTSDQAHELNRPLRDAGIGHVLFVTFDGVRLS